MGPCQRAGQPLHRPQLRRDQQAAARSGLGGAAQQPDDVPVGESVRFTSSAAAFQSRCAVACSSIRMQWPPQSNEIATPDTWGALSCASCALVAAAGELANEAPQVLPLRRRELVPELAQRNGVLATPERLVHLLSDMTTIASHFQPLQHDHPRPG